MGRRSKKNGLLASLFSFTLLLISLQGQANIAQPGIFQTGGSGSLSVLYPSDSIGMSKISMRSEAVFIDLYPGIGVVRGEYEMFNYSEDTINIHLGYPMYSMYEGRNIDGHFEMLFDSLNFLRAFSNGEAQEIKNESEGSYSDFSNWYTWENEFLPFTSTEIIVEFAVPTNEAMVREGYNKKAIDGFAYVLETGRIWADSIKKGTVLIRLNDLDFKNIEGVSPVHVFKVNVDEGFLLYEFENLEPNYTDNVIITLNESSESDFPGSFEEAEMYFSNIKDLSEIETDKIEWEEKTFANPFELPTPATTYAFLFIIIALVIGAIIVLFIIFRKTLSTLFGFFKSR